MIVVDVTIDKNKLRKVGNRRDAIRKAQQAAFEAMGREWHAKFLMLHFQESAYDRYDIKRVGRRAGRDSKAFRYSHTGRKLRRKGHMRPLVWTGQAMMESQLLRLTASSRWAKVRLSNRFNLRPRYSAISMRSEVTRVIPSESAYLRRVAAAAMKAKLKELQQS